MFLDSFEEVDQWMLLLSRNGVKELILTNSSQCYKLPSNVFSCLELTKLKLENCFFKPPDEFKGFVNLNDLDLQNIDFGANLCGTEKPIEDNVQVEKTTLPIMLSNLPKIVVLYLDGVFFKALIEEKIPKWLPHPVNSLKRLFFLNFQLGDLDQLHGALCLLRNSPNLERLSVTSFQMRFRLIRYDLEPASDHLEDPNCLDCTLDQLQTVEMTRLEGSKPELLFIKLILAHSPSLLKFTIRPSKFSDVQKRLDIAKDVMQFPRASPKAKMFYLNP
ncbi:unnamed protein product [Lactuca virosa]|uniref:FBD domain-containing protein n=1 Tax=Lactuca virosa TaxID=75947 RepID=A0AAU9NTC0_9ASTR|nr:unnamed protein product [Lactuca virosa]